MGQFSLIIYILLIYVFNMVETMHGNIDIIINGYILLSSGMIPL
nr:MAG TPA: hypothetical protein [Caudoviricetes sp.]